MVCMNYLRDQDVIQKCMRRLFLVLKDAESSSNGTKLEIKMKKLGVKC